MYFAYSYCRPSVEDIEEGRFPPVNGIGLYQVGSLINHDCEPNCELIFDESSPNPSVRNIDEIKIKSRSLSHLYS